LLRPTLSPPASFVGGGPLMLDRGCAKCKESAKRTHD
jgi:hypothetical protein